MTSEPGHDLIRRAASAGAWVVAMRVVSRLIRIVRTVVLARVLVPDDFGLMAVAMLALAFLLRLSEPGLNQALVQRRDVSERYLNAAWTVEIARGILIGSALVAAAPAVSSFFGAPEATNLIRAIGAVPVINALANIAVIAYERQLEFRPLFTVQISATVADLVVAIPLAISMRSPWALVLGALASATARTIATYIVHPFRPRLVRHPAESLELFRFGKWVMASHALTYSLSELDDIIVGRSLGTTPLGLYRIGFVISQLPVSEVAHVIGRVSFPAFAEIQDSTDRLRRGFLKTAQTVSLAAFPLAALAIVAGPSLINGILGPAWRDAIRPMQFLALWGAVRAMEDITVPLFQGIGKPSIATGLQAARLAIFVPLLLVLVPAHGLVGAALAGVVNTVAALPFYLGIAFRNLSAGWRDWYEQIHIPLMAVLAGAAAAATVALTTQTGPIAELLLVGVSFAAVWGGILIGAHLWASRSPLEPVLALVRTSRSQKGTGKTTPQA